MPINIAVHKGTLHAFRSYLCGNDIGIAGNIEAAIETARRDSRLPPSVSPAARLEPVSGCSVISSDWCRVFRFCLFQ